MKLSIDAGNSAIKVWNDISPVRSIRSIYAQLPTSRKPLMTNSASPLIETDKGRLHFGEKAKEYRSYQSVVKGNKLEMMQELILAAIPKGTTELDLVLSTPQPELTEQKIRAALGHGASYKLNGAPMSVTFNSIKVVEEGRGAYELAKESGQVKPEGMTVLVDIGGSTAISRLYSETGELLDSYVGERAGVFELASLILNDVRLYSQVPNPEVAVVMEGLGNGTNRYGLTSVSWSEYLHEHRSTWFKSILTNVRSRFQHSFPYITRFVFAGGGSNLIELPSNPLFAKLSRPEHANVVGMFNLLRDGAE